MRKKLLFIYALNQTFHWFIVGLLVPVMVLLQLEKGLDLFQIEPEGNLQEALAKVGTFIPGGVGPGSLV